MAGGEGSKLKKVMVAIDESECSHYALEWALDNLHGSLSSPLVVFTAQPYANVGYMAAASYGAPRMGLRFHELAPELIQSVQEHNKKLSLAILAKAKEICAKRGVATETISEIGDPKEVICEAVDKLSVDLLILGSHSRGALERLFVGSVSNYCLHNAKCPVLVVKKQV